MDIQPKVQLSIPGLEPIASPKRGKVKREPQVTYCKEIDWSLPDSLDCDYAPVILSYGLGVDSTALLLRLLFEPECRDFPLQNLVVVVAMTGDEWERTAWLVQRFILPLLRRFNIWTIQVSRGGEREQDGIVIHSSTRSPQRLYIEGAYTLAQHLLVNGMIPLKAKGKRFCTMKFKAFPIDLVVKLFFGDSPQKRYRRMIGFNADEVERAQVDRSYGEKPRYLVGYNADEVERANDSSLTMGQSYRYLLGFNADEDNRRKEETVTWRNQMFEFLLILWGWGRQQCERYLTEMTYLIELSEQVWVESDRSLDQTAVHYHKDVGLRSSVVCPTFWRKSCCGYCPHSCSNGGDEAIRTSRRKGRRSSRELKLRQMRDSWDGQPEMGGWAAYIEQNALAINRFNGLYDSGAKRRRTPIRTVLSELEAAGNHRAIAHYQALVKGNSRWAVYVVRRVFEAAKPASKATVEKAKRRGKVAKPFYGTPPRQVIRVFEGTQTEAEAYLVQLAGCYGKSPLMIALSNRFWSVERPVDETRRPFVEEMFVSCFVETGEKQDQRVDFDGLWHRVMGSYPSIIDPEIGKSISHKGVLGREGTYAHKSAQSAIVLASVSRYLQGDLI